MSEEVFDAVIVGTGLTASLAADALARKGLRLCMLERGRDELYAPRHEKEYWHEATVTRDVDGRRISLNAWHHIIEDGFRNPAFDDLCMAEHAGEAAHFRYNMRYGYGGSGAVWSGRTWRFYPEDFSTRATFGYGLDWPVGADEMRPWYDRAEAFFDVSGPMEGDWPWPRNFQTDAFPFTHLDGKIRPLLEDDHLFLRTSNSARNAPTLDGGCVAAKTCVQFCPSNTIVRPHIRLVEPLRRDGRVTIRFDALTTHLEADEHGRIVAAHTVSRAGERSTVKARRFLLCGNTIENIRILKNSALETGKPICDAAGLLGRYFSSHGAALARITHVDDLRPGRGRISTAAALDRALGRNRGGGGAHMFEIFNFDFRRWETEHALNRLRAETRLRGRALMDEARRYARQTLISGIFEIELRRENRVELSDKRDSWGMPIARIDMSLSPRDEATAETLERRIRAMEAHPDCEAVDYLGRGVNGNHPIGGYVASADLKSGVVDPLGRAHGHDNLWLFGGGALNSTSCFNPSLTIAANTMRMLEDERLTS